MVLDYTVTCNNIRIFDFTYMKYIFQKFRKASTIAHCINLISWLSYCERPLNYLCAETMACRDLGLTECFILFELERIHLCRESASSNTATKMLGSAKKIPAEMTQIMRSFLECSECLLAFLNLIADRLSFANSFWMDIIENFPNSIRSAIGPSSMMDDQSRKDSRERSERKYDES
jgi:hypothetical protein